MHKVHESAPAKLQVNGVARIWQSSVASVTPVSTEADPALADQTKFKGLNPPHFYIVDLQIAGEGGLLRPGMTGLARVYGKRSSLDGLGWESLKVVLGRKIW